MFALDISEKIHFFALFLAFLGKFFMIFKKIYCRRFSFFARTIPGLECFQGLYQVTCHCFRVGEKQPCGKKGNLKKSDFLGFMPKLLPILDFRVQHWNIAKIQLITKSQNFENASLHFLSLFFNFRTLVRLSEIFWIIGITFFYSHYFCFKFGRVL